MPRSVCSQCKAAIMRDPRINFGGYGRRFRSGFTKRREPVYRSIDQLKRLWQDESGQDLVEYVLLVTLVSLATIAAVQTFGVAVEVLFKNSASNISQS
jgi:Flp pilus assembly pilin Flp